METQEKAQHRTPHLKAWLPCCHVMDHIGWAFFLRDAHIPVDRLIGPFPLFSAHHAR